MALKRAKRLWELFKPLVKTASGTSDSIFL